MKWRAVISVLVGVPCLFAGCMGGEPESTIKLSTQPMKASVSLAPNILIQKRLESADQRPSTKAMVAAPSPLPPRVITSNQVGSTEVARKTEDRPRVEKRVSGDADKKESKLQPEAKSDPANSPTPPPVASVSVAGETSSRLEFKKANLPADIPSWFSENDRDTDGMVGLHEWPKDRRAEFRKYDHNGDGLITIDEAMRTVARAKGPASGSASAGSAPSSASSATAAAGPAIAVLEEKDRLAAEGSIRRYGNKRLPNKLTQEEMPFFYKKDRFAEFDKDRDGGLDVAELAAFLKATTGAAAEVARGGDGDANGRDGGRGDFRSGENRDGNRGENREGRGGRDPDQWARNMFKNIDKKGAGRITKDEIPDYMRTFKSKFEENDTNRDGFLDFEEFKTGMGRAFRRGG